MRTKVATARWIKVLPQDAFEESTRVQVEGHPVALFRLEDGIYALDDICSHEYSQLSEGEIWDEDVYCPKHGSRFNIRTGAVKGLPAVKPVSTHPVKVEQGAVYLLWK